LRLLGGGRNGDSVHSDTIDVIAEQSAAGDVFHREEKEMIRGVLDLVERPVRSIMSPRNEVEWLDLDETNEELLAEIRTLTHSRVVLAHGRVDEFVGVALTKDLLFAILDGGKIDWDKVTRQPLILHENANVLRVMEQLRGTTVQMAVVLDEHGSFEGVVTPTDILEAIAGDFPDEGDESPVLERSDDGSMVVDAYIDIRRLGGLIERDLVDDGDRYTTLAGYILWNLGHIPAQGEKLKVDDYEYEIVEMDGRNIGKVKISPTETAAFI
ncbi:MAG: hemolysin family protein, partial [Pyrinomonadaceae bacterium]